MKLAACVVWVIAFTTGCGADRSEPSPRTVDATIAAFKRHGITLNALSIDLRSKFQWDYSNPEPAAILISDAPERPEINVWVFENARDVDGLADALPSSPRVRYVARDNVVAACIECSPSGWATVRSALDGT
jgi:hypothetical protein